ncbi:FAR-17a/AIG1-like protein [Lipomyces tetrasporus]|uniref:FAR-17a/AIG1-like protein n=1 Tax=Lipomyces tetrasporus TaxID=54092 RepID=A0AAD7VRM8_9ASCO|nr:FAR-17a/AIG1-like protein [Lipomyces tetrasporus]KAJ8098829.1 FAR-17a/AIG1-like protein [Lipomyces tetrasporus]
MAMAMSTPEGEELTMMSWSSGLYALAAVIFNMALRFVLMADIPINKSYGGQLQFLTILGVVGSYITVTIGLLANIVGSPFLLRVKNSLLVLSAPVEVLISILYGSISLVNRELLVPKSVTFFMPPQMDFALHGAPAILLVIDFLYFSPNWTTSPLAVLTIYSSAGVAYWMWVHRTYAVNNYFPYPLLEIVTTEQRALIFAVSIVILYGVFFSLRKLHSIVNKAHVKSEKTA